MAPFDRKYTDAQRDAVIFAYLDNGVRPMARIPKMAKAGELTLHGERLDPFDIPYATAQHLITTERRRRKTRTTADPVDAVEAMRQRLIAAAQRGLTTLERKQAKQGTDWELLRQAARCLREIQALPAPGARAVKPGQRDPNTGEHAGGHTRGGLAGAMLAAAARSNAEPGTAPEHLSSQPSPTETTDEGAHERSAAHDAPDVQTHDRAMTPGAAARRLVAIQQDAGRQHAGRIG